MKWIGLTGGIASGKTTVANGLRSRGFQVIDADELAKRAIEPGTEGLRRVAQAFGPDVLRSDGGLDRVKLGKLVFAKPDLRQTLESIIHPEVRRLAKAERARLESEGHKLIFYDVPLLFEKKMESMFDLVVVVAATEKLQRQRLSVRSGLSPEEVRDRLASQLPLAQKIAKADYVIENDGNLQELEKSLDKFVAVLK